MKFIAQVFIVVEADSPATACDAVSGALSENLMQSGALVDWAYCSVPGTYPRICSQNVVPDQTELSIVWEESRPFERNRLTGTF